MSRSPPICRILRNGAGTAVLGLFFGCSGGGSGGGFPGPTGIELEKPGGGTFFLDPHQGGAATRIHLVEAAWGRLVDVHALAPDGEVDPAPVFREMLVNETVQSDGLDYRLETNAITQRTRLVILRQRGPSAGGQETFEALLARARNNLPPIVPKADDGSAAGPFSLMARNACLSLRCDDLLEDGPLARLALGEMVRVLTGYPPETPFVARIFFDPNHGGIAGGAFHSTRILVDTTVSEEEALGGDPTLVINSLGLPASFPLDERPNVSVRLPSRPDPGSGVFSVLTNLSGAAMDLRSNGPIDLDVPTRDVVRALRAGRADDANAGFLLDLNRPELIGTWPIVVEAAAFDPAGTEGFDLLLDLRFVGVCRRGLRPGDILQAGERILEVRAPSADPNVEGSVRDARARLTGAEPLAQPGGVLGGATYLSTYANGLPIPAACWASVVPTPQAAPDRGLSEGSQFVVRFSEPMNPASVDPFDTLRLVRGNSSTPPGPFSLVVAEAVGSGDLRTFRSRPRLPLARGVTGEYHLELVGGAGGLTDLAGNRIASVPGALEFELAPGEGASENGGVVLRFGSTDELEPVGLDDLRGQFFYDFSRGTIRGRAPVYEGYAADRTQPVPGIMIPFAPGVQTPLSGLGSKLQAVWRYCDYGWIVEDESKHNLDVVGINWTPVGGLVLNDFFERFEMRLSHSRRQPDEFRTFVGTTYPCSGLGAGANTCPPCETFVPFEDNLLRDPRSPQQTVHDRSLGYRIDSRDLFVGVSGALLMPFPMNRAGAPFTSFTWRDTSVLAKDGLDSVGIPLLIEVGAPLNLVPAPAGRIAIGGKVPAWGLPLLLEVRCFPSSAALGFNPLEIYLAQNAQQLPCFRAFSTGGVNETGFAVQVNPDLSLVPEGGFNPNSRPPGMRTRFEADNSFYASQLDTVVRVSRAHTIWIESTLVDPHYLPPVVSPRPGEQPGSSRVELEFRGASAFTGDAVTEAFDARKLDPLGDVGELEVEFHRDDPTWSADLERLDGARYVQMRITFVNDIVAQVGPELSAVGLAYVAR
jgi:hypothetical protein